jgi:dCTP deaminase
VILSNEGIKDALSRKQIVIDPAPSDDQYTTSAVDLILGDDFKIWDVEKFKTPGLRLDLNLAEQQFVQTAASFLVPLQPDKDGCVLLPPYSVHPWPLLAITQERVCLNRESRIAARVEGRSSLARLGLVVHLTAPTIHAGFIGKITLEIINFGPFHLRLVPHHTRICQLIFERLETTAAGDPVTAFQGQTDPSGTKA